MFSDAAEGCVGLVSSGTSGQESVFLDASAGGGDAFFLTAAQLAPEDVDSAFDVYDAHECSTGWPCPTATTVVSTAACSTAESCRTAPPPEVGSSSQAATATFAGEGNLASTPMPATRAAKSESRAEKLIKALKRCKSKQSKKQRAACEAQARKAYGPAKQKRVAKKIDRRAK